MIKWQPVRNGLGKILFYASTMKQTKQKIKSALGNTFPKYIIIQDPTENVWSAMVFDHADNTLQEGGLVKHVDQIGQIYALLKSPNAVLKEAKKICQEFEDIPKGEPKPMKKSDRQVIIKAYATKAEQYGYLSEKLEHEMDKVERFSIVLMMQKAEDAMNTLWELIIELELTGDFSEDYSLKGRQRFLAEQKEK